MQEDNRTIVTRWFEAVWNERRGDMIDEMITEDSVCFTDEGPIYGNEDFRQRLYLPLLQAYPDLHVHVDGVIANDEEVVVRWTATGTHRYVGPPIAPTEQVISVVGISWLRICEGKLRENWQSSNVTDFRHVPELQPR